MDGPEAGDHAHCGNPRHAKHCSHESSSPRGYLPIESYGVIGNCHTAALIGTDGSLDYLCWPDFDSPTVFCRLLDSRKGGHFSITPIGALTSKSRSGPTGHSVEAAGHAVDLDADGYKFRGEQHYHPMTNVLITRSINENGDVVRLTDFAVPLTKDRPANKKFPWIIREIECIRGAADVKVECFPAFDYARASHAVDIEHIPQQRRSSVSTASPGDDLLENPYSPTHQRSAVRTATEVCPNRVRFTSAGGGPSFDIRSVLSYDAIYREQLKGRAGADGDEAQLEALCEIQWKVADSADHLGPGAVAVLSMREGQRVSLVFREVPGQDGHRRPEPVLTGELVELLQKDTVAYWKDWLSKSNYKGRYRELVHRSALVLKMLCYEPTGAIVASPTFGLPEHIGGTRNWDYRYCWIRDASFLIYALVRLGLTTEAWNYKEFIASCSSNFPNDGSSPLKIMYTIRGSTDLPEIELEHLEGYHGSRPVRIGNAAVTHLQLDIYGALLDAAYLFDKYHEPIGYDFWLVLRVLTDWLCDNWNTVDQSVWEVRAGTHVSCLGFAILGVTDALSASPALHLQPPHVLGRPRPRDPVRQQALQPALPAARALDRRAGPDLRDRDGFLVQRGQGMLRHERRDGRRGCAGRELPDDAAGLLHRPHGSADAEHHPPHHAAARARRAHRQRPCLPLRSLGV